MTKEVMLIILRDQDKRLKELFKDRKYIAKIAKEQGIYNELWEELMSDGEKHYSV